MAAKFGKFRSGRKYKVCSYRLPNGNLLVLQRNSQDRRIIEWVEAAPGTPLYKFWINLAVDELPPQKK